MLAVAATLQQRFRRRVVVGHLDGSYSVLFSPGLRARPLGVVGLGSVGGLLFRLQEGLEPGLGPALVGRALLVLRLSNL